MVRRYVKREESEAQILEAIHELRQQLGYGPSYRELGNHVGLAASAVHEYVANLERAGLVHDTPNTARTLRLAPAGVHLLRERYGEGSVAAETSE